MSEDRLVLADRCEAGEYMRQSRRVLAVDSCEARRVRYQTVLGVAKIDCDAYPTAEEAFDNLEGAGVIFVCSDNLSLVARAREAGWNKPIVLFDGNLEGTASQYGVNEKWNQRRWFGTLSPEQVIAQVAEKYLAPKPRILCVDDEPVIRTLTRLMIGEKMGYEPVMAKNGEDALQHVPSVHLVVTDINQPGYIGGIELTGHIREHYTASQLPVILISGDGDFVDLVEHLKRALGCRVEVVAFGKSTNAKLREVADSFLDLDKNTKKYLIKPTARRPVKKEIDTHRMGDKKNVRSK